MAGQPTKKGSWGDWAVIEPKPNKYRISCSFCAFHSSDGSCQMKPIVLSDVGYNYWRNCNSFLLDMDHDSTHFREMVNRVKRQDSPYQSYNSSLYRSLYDKAYARSIPDASSNANAFSKVAPANDCYYLQEDRSLKNFIQCICTNGYSPFFKSKCKQRCFLYVKSTHQKSEFHLTNTSSPPKNKLSHELNSKRSVTKKNTCYYLEGTKCRAYDVTCTRPSGKCFMGDSRLVTVGTKKRSTTSKTNTKGNGSL